MVWASIRHMGGCQNYGSFLGTLNIRCRTILGTHKGTTILTTTHIGTWDPLSIHRTPHVQCPQLT